MFKIILLIALSACLLSCKTVTYSEEMPNGIIKTVKVETAFTDTKLGKLDILVEDPATNLKKSINIEDYSSDEKVTELLLQVAKAVEAAAKAVPQVP